MCAIMPVRFQCFTVSAAISGMSSIKRLVYLNTHTGHAQMHKQLAKTGKQWYLLVRLGSNTNQILT